MIVEVPRAVCTSINGLECAARTSSYLHTHSADRALCIPPIDATYGMLARSSRVARQARLLVRASPSIRRSCSYAARWIIFLAPFELFLRCKITLSCTNSASCGQYSLRSLSVRITGESGKYGLRLAVPSRKQNNIMNMSYAVGAPCRRGRGCCRDLSRSMQDNACGGRRCLSIGSAHTLPHKRCQRSGGARRQSP